MPRQADYGSFERLRYGDPTVLSNDGRWLAYRTERVDGEHYLRVLSLVDGDDTSYSFPHGRAAEFSDDSAWLAWTVDLSEEERETRSRADQPIRLGVGLLDLSSGETQTFDAVKSFAFDDTGRFLAIRSYAPEDLEGAGTALRVLHLGTENETTFGQVVELAWSHMGSQLALVVQAGADAGSGIQVYDAGSGRLVGLEASKSAYRGLSWREEGNDLAALRSVEPAIEEGTAHVALAWKDVASTPEPFVLAPPSDHLDAPLEVSRHGRPEWSDDGRIVSVGLRPVGGGDEDDESDSESLTSVQIWHSSDVRVFPQQKASQSRDESRVLRAAWHLDTGRLVQLGTELLAELEIANDWRHSIERLDGAYTWGAKFGRPYHDVWAADIATGTRRLVAERVRYSWTSAGGRYLLTFADGAYATVDLHTGRHVELSRSLEARFEDSEYDTPTDMLPPYGIGGWLEDDAAVLVYDRFDVWRLTPDGSEARRLTDGATSEIQYRLIDLDEEEEAYHDTESLYFATWSDRTEERGFARLRADADMAQPLLFEHAFLSLLTRAGDADVFVFCRRTRVEPPQYFVAGPDLDSARRVSALNTFQDDYAWTRSELINFQSDAGVPLQAALLYPANHDPSRRYPMIVYTYEKQTPWVHLYIPPDERDYYNPTVWALAGYFVLMPDIVYRARDPGMSALDAVRPAVAAVVERGLADGDRVGLVGHSWGGYQAAFLPTRTDIFAASVAGAPLTDFVSFMGQIHWNPGLPEVDHWETGQARMEVPFWEDPEAHRRNSPVHAVHEMETPLLMAHGDDDGVVEFFQSTVFYNFARRAGKQMVLLVYAGEDHGFRQKQNQIDYHRRILEWFGHYLKGERAPEWILDGVELGELDDEKRRVARTQASSAAVGLGHLSIVLDAETFAVVRASTVVGSELGATDAGPPKFEAPDDTSQSIYIRGRTTYLELLGPQHQRGRPVGTVGIGLGADRAGDFDAVRRLWSESFGEAMADSTLDRPGDPGTSVAGAESIARRSAPDSSDPTLSLSVYRPGFLRSLYPDRSLDESAVSRSDFLEPHYDPERWLDDIVGVTLALSPSGRDSLARWLEVSGYVREEGADAVMYNGPDFAVTLVAESDTRSGLVGIDMMTTQPKRGLRIVQVGATTLFFGADGGLTWSFPAQ